MLTLHVSSRFKRSFKKLPARVKNSFAERIDIFRKQPFDRRLRTHKLHGNLDTYYAFYLVEGYRVIFEFANGNNVLLINIGSHNDYSRWEKG